MSQIQSMPGDQLAHPQKAIAVSGLPTIDAKHEAHRIYRLVDSDEKVLERTAREVVEGSKLFNNYELWLGNFRAIASELAHWCDQRRSVLRQALADIRSNKVLFYFVPVDDEYNMDLGREMTDLEMKLCSGGIGFVETLQVPARRLESFVGPRSLLIWSGDTVAAVPALPEPQ